MKNKWKAYVLLIICIILTCFKTINTKNDIDDEKLEDFKANCTEIKTKIELRLRSHALLLRAGSAFFAALDTITRKEWEVFCEWTRINRNLSGIQGLGYSLIIPQNQLQAHIQKIKNEGFSNYSIRPEGNRSIYTSIIYLEPFTGRNLRAFGFDMFSENVRRNAMERARDLDIASLSGKVILVQETSKDVQAGTLMYVPVYRNGMPIYTIEQRRNAIKGWVYSPYRMNDLMYGILGHWDNKIRGRIQLKIYDDENQFEKSLLYNSQQSNSIKKNEEPVHLFVTSIDFNGKKWFLSFSQNDEYLTLYSKVVIVFIAGIIISLLLFFLTLSLINTKAKAQQIAESLTFKLQQLNDQLENRVVERTMELQRSEDKFRLLFENMTNGFTLYEILMDENENVIDIKILEVNDKGAIYFNKKREEVVNKTIKELTLSFNEEEHINTINVAKTGIPICFERYSKHQNVYVRVYMYSPQKNRTAVILENITEQKLIEISLKKQEIQMRTLLNTMPDSVWLKDCEGHYIFCNSMYEKLFEIKESQIIGKKDDSFLSKELVDNFSKTDKHVIDTQKQLKYANKITYKDGTQAITETIKVPLFDDNNSLIGVLGIARDITEREKEKEELLNIEEKFQYFSSLTNEGLMIHVNGVIIEANQAFVQLIGFSNLSDIIGQNGLDIIPMSDESRVKVKEHISLSSQASYVIESYGKNGIIHYLELKGIGIYYKGQKSRLVFFNDITERILNEKALNESEDRFKNLSSLANEGLMIHQNGIIVDANIAFARIVGYNNPDDLIGQNGLNIIPLTEESKTTILQQINEKLEGTYLVDIIKTDGTIIHAENSGKGILYKGQTARLVLLRDITDKVLTQNVLKERNKLIESVFNLSPDILYIYDVIERKNVFGNKGMEKILGYSEQDIFEFGSNVISELMHPEDFVFYCENTIPLYLTAIDEELIFSQYRMKDNQGEWHWLESAEMIYKRQENGQPAQILGFAHDVTNTKILEQKVLNSVIETEEKERLYFSQELHDGISPILSAVKMYVQWLFKHEIAEEKQKVIIDIEKLLEESILTIRELSFNLSPHILQNYGLIEALNSFANKIQKKASILIEIDNDGITRFDDKIEIVLYRVLCECVNNSIKHSNASEVRINLSKSKSILKVEYVDNGIGFDVKSLTSDIKGIGLLNMQSRIKSINGEFKIYSEEGIGTNIKIRVKV